MQCFTHSRLRIIAAGVISRQGGSTGDSIPKAFTILEFARCESILTHPNSGTAEQGANAMSEIARGFGRHLFEPNRKLEI
jgi:hypothetical protein